MPNRRAFIGTSTVAAAGLMFDWRRVWAQAAKGVPGATVDGSSFSLPLLGDKAYRVGYVGEFVAF